MPKLILKQHWSTQCHAGVRWDTKINGIDKDLQINQYIDGQLIFDKGAKSLQWEKEKINFTKLKNICFNKYHSKIKKKTSHIRRKYLQTIHLIKDLGTESIKNTSDSQEDKKKLKLKWAKDLNIQFTKALWMQIRSWKMFNIISY